VTEREALLAAVCEAPADDTARLVYADWLDETGDPADAKRAAYIRAAVAQWRLEDAGTPAALVHAFLDDRRSLSGDRAMLDPVDWAAVDPDVGAIYAADRARKAARLPRAALAAGLPVVKGVTFDREDVGGFYNEVVVRDPAAFLAHAETIFRAAPIYYIGFRRRPVTAEFARDFVAAGHLARARWLGFEDIEPEAIRVFGDHPDAAGVELLEFDVTRDEELVEQFVAGPHWTGLTDLYVRRFWDGGDDAVSALVPRCPRFRGLRHLSLIGDQVGDATARAIATGGFTELRNIDLRFSFVSSDGVAALAGSSKLPNLRYIDLERCERCGAAGVSRLLASPKLKNLLALRAAACGTGDGLIDPRVLAGPTRGPTLRALELDTTPLGARAMAALAACPAAQGLWFLSLAGCGVADDALRRLTGAAGFRELTVLDLSRNQLTDAGAQLLADWPVPLQSINLAENAIGPAGAKAFIKSPHRQGLKRLLMDGRGAAHLRKHFGKRVVP
jgi:uncharacterized protein (TIGR02996 family)